MHNDYIIARWVGCLILKRIMIYVRDSYATSRIIKKISRLICKFPPAAIATANFANAAVISRAI